MPEVEDQVRDYAAAAGDAVPPLALARVTRPRGAHPPRWLVTAAAVACVITGLAAFLALRDEEPRGLVTELPYPTADRWETLPDAPIAGRTSAVAVATDHEIIVWGGVADDPLADGAAFDLDAGTWRTLAASPLSPRYEAVGVWTGTEVLVWGGRSVVGDSSETPLHDGAAYDPAMDSWRLLPTLDAGAWAGSTGAVWTGAELVLIGTIDLAGAPTSDVWVLGAAGWTSRPPVPALSPSDQQRRGLTALLSGDEVLVVSITDLAPVVVDRLALTSRTWGTRITTAVDGLDLETDAVALVGSRLFLLAQPGAVVDLASGTSRSLAMSGSSSRFGAVVVKGVVTVGDRWLDPDRLTWHESATIPPPVREFPMTVAASGRAFVISGSGCPPGAGCSGYVEAGPPLAWSPP